MNVELKEKKTPFSFVHPHVKEKRRLSCVASVISCSATFWQPLLFVANFWQHNIPVFKKYADTSFVCHIDNDQERTNDLSYHASLLKGTHHPLCCVMTAMKAGFTVDHNSQRSMVILEKVGLLFREFFMEGY